MRVAGFGFRKGAGVESLLDALSGAGGAGVTHVATVEAKAGAACLTELAAKLGVPVCAIGSKDLAKAEVATHSEKSVAMYGTGSVSEAAALVAAGPGARLIAERSLSADKMATCAIAEGGME